MLWTIFSNLSITMIMSIFNILELSSNSDSAASRNFYREHSGIAYTTIRIIQKQDQYFTLLNSGRVLGPLLDCVHAIVYNILVLTLY